MRKKILLTSLAVIFLIAFGIPVGQAAAKAKFTMRLQTSWPTAFALNIAAKHFADQIEMRSNNQIDVQFYTAGQLVPAMEVWDSASMGVIDAAHSCTCYTVGKTWMGGFFCNGPSMPPPALKLLWMKKGGGLELAQKILGKFYKVKVLPAFVTVEPWAYSNKEINSLDDMRKLKFRASGVRASTMKNMGISVVSLPGGEIIPAIEKGVIDAFEFSTLTWDQGFGADKVAKYVYYSHYVDSGNGFLAINEKWWNKIGPELQKAIEQASWDTVEWTLGEIAISELNAMHIAETENNTEIKWLPPDVEKGLIKSVKELIAERIKKGDKEAIEFMDSMDAFMAKYGKYAEFRSNIY